MTSTADDNKTRYHFDRHTPEYRSQFEKITQEMHRKCPVAWTDTYDGHWVAAGSKEVFELARCPAVSNHHDVSGETPFKGITIPYAKRINGVRGGMLEMDDPEHRRYRALVSTAFGQKAIARWEAGLVEPIASPIPIPPMSEPGCKTQ